MLIFGFKQKHFFKYIYLSWDVSSLRNFCSTGKIQQSTLGKVDELNHNFLTASLRFICHVYLYIEI